MIFLSSCSDDNNAYKPSQNVSNAEFFLSLKDENGDFRIAKDSEFIILIPDTQYYIHNASNNKYLEQIITWILQFNNAGFKTRAVLQLGDITESNSDVEFQRVKRIFSPLDSYIDYIFCTGNHDYGTNGTANNRNTLFSNYLTYEQNKSLVSTYKSGEFENSFFQINLFDKPLRIYSLEFGPSNDVLNWVLNLEKNNHGDNALLLTHTYLAPNRERYNYSKYKLSQGPSPYAYGLSSLVKVNDGEEIWQKIIVNNPNFKFIFSGHNLSPGNDFHLISRNDIGNNVLQMVYNKQDSPNGGDGWIKILEFTKDKKLFAKSYSPFLNKWEYNDLSNNPFSF
jgi:hypothetical protein